MTTPEPSAGSFGANSWLVEEMYEQFRSDPDSVSDTWREFFDDYKTLAPVAPVAPAPQPAGSGAVAAAPATAPAPAAAPASAAAPAAAAPVAPATPSGADAVEEVGEPIRGAGVAIAANMERSLSVPTATSFRNVPAKLLR